jgi:ABC-type Na+ transport system ATPase subunit NatA
VGFVFQVKWFGAEDIRTYAVRDVSFEANYGEMLYITGPSGSGKTTLLSMISGILRPNAGTVVVEGKEIWKLSDAGGKNPLDIGILGRSKGRRQRFFPDAVDRKATSPTGPILTFFLKCLELLRKY